MFQRVIKICLPKQKMHFTERISSGDPPKTRTTPDYYRTSTSKNENDKLENYLFFFLIRGQDDWSILQYREEFSLKWGRVGGSSKTGL